jgi:HEAT repeat protein
MTPAEALGIGVLLVVYVTAVLLGLAAVAGYAPEPYDWVAMVALTFVYLPTIRLFTAIADGLNHEERVVRQAAGIISAVYLAPLVVALVGTGEVSYEEARAELEDMLLGGVAA